MHGICSTGFARGATLFLGCGLGAVSALSAFRNGNTLGADNIDKIVFGSGFVFVVALTWVLPTLADDWRARRKFGGALFLMLVWAACLVFAVWNAVGFTALHRGHAVAGRETGMERYDLAKADIARLEADIATAKASKEGAAIYKRTSACASATEEASIKFCASLAGREAELASAKLTVKAGKPGSADPQSEVVSWATGYHPADLGRAFPIAFGILVELGAIAAFYAALGGESKLEAPMPPREAYAAPEPTSRLLETIDVKPVRVAKKREILALPAPGIRLRLDGKIDQRCSFARAAKKMSA
jgi:hypothetical protein